MGSSAACYPPSLASSVWGSCSARVCPSATPAFHHWHHSAEADALDKNFSVHTPIWDILFGTYYLPDSWPTRYGLNGGGKVPRGWFSQLVYPMARQWRGRG